MGIEPTARCSRATGFEDQGSHQTSNASAAPAIVLDPRAVLYNAHMNTELNRVAVVTGASSGIGLAAAKVLAGSGWRVIALGRDAERTERAAADIRSAAAQNARIDVIRGDLASLADTVRMADAIAGLTDQVHVLLNNAGGVRAERVITSEGNEATFAGNHLGHFLLTHRLMPRLRAAVVGSEPRAVRVVNVSSNAHEYCTGINWSDLQQMGEWSSVKVYCLAKLCNVLFTRELAKRVAGDGIVATAMHPGVVSSNFANHAEPGMKSYLRTLASISPDEAADTLVWLATASEAGGASGGYFQNRKQIEPSRAGQDDAAAARLWAESEALVGGAGIDLAGFTAPH
jgi:NAD(P)-dependent dehydrogenase (short-subunit alcohol dehydrogenase family)